MTTKGSRDSTWTDRLHAWLNPMEREPAIEFGLHESLGHRGIRVSVQARCHLALRTA